MANKTLRYPFAAVAIAPLGTTSYTSSHVVHGAQSIGMDTNFNIERVFEIGQSTEYEAVENIPDVSVNLTKVLDGYCPMYLLASNGSSNATLQGRADAQCIVGLAIYPDDFASASGTPLQQVDVSGCFIGSVGYNFPVEGNFTEEMGLVSNSKVWKASSFGFTGVIFDNLDQPKSIYGSGGINRREDLIFSPVDGGTILPPDIAGITSSGTNEASNGIFGASLQNIRVSVDLGREGVKELGRKKDYYKYRSPTVIVTTEVEAICKTGDLVNAYDDGRDNLTSRQIRIKTREGLTLDLGTKNKMESSSMAGIEAGGGNATMSYRFSNANYFTVTHFDDVTSALRA